MTYLEKLYNTERKVFWIVAIVLFPILLYILYRKMAMEFEVNSINKGFAETKKTDAELAQTETSDEAKAATAKASADTIQKEVDGVTVSADWNEKK